MLSTSKSASSAGINIVAGKTLWTLQTLSVGKFAGKLLRTRGPFQQFHNENTTTQHSELKIHPLYCVDTYRHVGFATSIPSLGNGVHKLTTDTKVT